MPVKLSVRGFALFEVMVTVFLLAFGVLGLAAAQMKTYAITRDADYRTNVALHAEGLAEAMRANPLRKLASGVMSWDLSHYKENAPIKGSALLSVPANDCHSRDCTQKELAEYDLYLFHQRLRASFPEDSEVSAQVCPSADFSKLPTQDNMGCASSGVMAIKVVWLSKATKSEAQAASAGATRNMLVSAYQLKVEP